MGYGDKAHVEQLVSQALQGLSYQFFKAKKLETPEELGKCAQYMVQTGPLQSSVLQDARVRRAKQKLVDLCEEKISELSKTNDLCLLARCIANSRSWCSTALTSRMLDDYMALDAEQKKISGTTHAQ